MRPTAHLAALLTLATLLACTDRGEPQKPPPDGPAVAPGEAEGHEQPDPPAQTPKPPAPDAAAAAEPPPAPPGFLPVPPAFDALPLTARLPADAFGLLAVSSPAALAERIGWTDLTAAFGPHADRERAQLAAELGHDLFDPQAWSAAGIDLQRPVGIAVLRYAPALAVISVAVKDPAALTAALKAGPISGLTVLNEGDLTLLHGGRTAFALRGDEAWWVLGDRMLPGEALHHARALAERPAATLLARETVGAVVARLNYGRDVAAIVNLPAIFDAALRRSMNTDPYARLERELLGARALGLTAEVAELEAELKRKRADDRGWGAASVATGMVLRSYLTPFGGLALGINVEPDAVQLRFTHHLDRDSPVGRIFASRTGPLALRAAFDRAPTGLVEGNIAPAAVIELVRALAAALGGRELSRLESQLRAAIGRDLDGLGKLLAGDLGGAAAVDPAAVTGSVSPDELLAKTRFAGHIGLTDPQGAAELFDGLVKLSQGALAAVPTPAEQPADAPRLWRMGLDATTTLWLAIAGHQLFASLDERTVRRLAAQVTTPPGKGFVADLPPVAAAMLDGADGGWSGWLDIAGLAPLMLERAPGVMPEPPEGSDAATKLRAQIVALDRQIEAHQQAYRTAQVKRGRALLAALGRVSASVSPRATGIDGRAGLYPGAGGVRGGLLAVVREMRASDEASRALWTETLDPLYSQQRALRAQLQALEDGAADRR